MPNSNKGAREDIRLKINQHLVESEIKNFQNLKSEAIKNVFAECGELYKQTLAKKIPSLGLGELNRSFHYRITTTKYGIQLSVGLLNKAQFNNVHDFLRFWLYGTMEHWVSLKAHPEVATWAIQHGLVYEKNDRYYRPNEYRITRDGRPYQTTGIQVSVRSHEWDVYEIQQEIKKQIIYKLTQRG